MGIQVEAVFLVREEISEEGLDGREEALGESIFTQADTLNDLDR